VVEWLLADADDVVTLVLKAIEMTSGDALVLARRDGAVLAAARVEGDEMAVAVRKTVDRSTLLDAQALDEAVRGLLRLFGEEAEG
jgi:hypothetical protein